MAKQESAIQKLTAEQKKKVIDWIAVHTKGKGKGCPVCGHPDWQLADDLVEINPRHKKNIFPPFVYPLVLLMCKNCTHVMLFHPVAMGIDDAE